MKAFVINLKDRKDRMTIFKMNNFPFKVKRFDAIQAEPGWIGCARSHLEIIREQKEFPFVIFEDDCVLMDSWDRVEAAILQLPPTWDILWLGASQSRIIARHSENIFIARDIYCHHSVIYNSQAIVDFYLNNYKYLLPIDAYTASVISYNFVCYLMNPMITRQVKGYSDIEKKVVDYAPWFDNLQNVLNSHPR